MPFAASGILTIPEIAKCVGVTEKTIYKLAEGMNIPAFKVGVSCRVWKADIDAWITEQWAVRIATRSRN